MAKLRLMCAVLLAAMWGRADLYAQERAVAEKTSPLVLTGSIPLPNVQGRIDHMSIDPKGRLFVSALGNNTEEVVDLSAGMRSRSISGIPRPQGVVYCADVNKLFVGSDEGKLYIYDASTFDLISSIEYGDDVDNLRYDAAKNSFTSDMEAAKQGRSEWWTQPPISDCRRNSSLGRIPSRFNWSRRDQTFTDRKS